MFGWKNRGVKHMVCGSHSSANDFINVSLSVNIRNVEKTETAGRYYWFWPSVIQAGINPHQDKVA